jgi:hypothetical protein
MGTDQLLAGLFLYLVDLILGKMNIFLYWLAVLVKARQTICQYIEGPWNMSDYQMNVRLKKNFLAKKESMTASSSLIL